MARRDPSAPPLVGSMKAEYAAARLLSMLPPRLQIRLAGGIPAVVEGQTLDPSTQLLLAVIERRGGTPKPPNLDVGRERAMLTRQSVTGAGVPDPVAAVRDMQIDGAEGPIGARFYRTAERGGPHPLLVYYHGGGFVLGDLDSHDSVCRTISFHAGCDVLSIDYRLAPEHLFPAAVDDARAAFDWAVANAADLGSDPTRVAVGGDSAGGNLAAVTALGAARSLSPPPFAQLLIYPVTDWLEDRQSMRSFADGFFLTADLMEWFGEQYVSHLDDSPENRSDWRLSPLRAEDHSGLAPALVLTAGFDPLRDEGEDYAAKLSEAGVEVVARRFPELIHGFVSMGGVSKAARDATLEACGSLRYLLNR